MSAPVLLLAPLSEAGSPRVAAVAGALQRQGVRTHTLLEALSKPADWRFVTTGAVTVALRRSSRVVVLPRRDGSIGRGTLRDIRLAERVPLPVYVVSPQGRMVKLADAGLVELNGRDQTNAAKFTQLEAAGR